MIAVQRDATLSVTILTATLMLLTGCSDPKAASNANFAKALEPVIANLFCSPIRANGLTTKANTAAPFPPFPIVIKAKPDEFDFDNRSELDGWARDGLLTRTERMMPAADWKGSEPLKPMDTVSYAPTDAGKAAFRGVAGKTSDGTVRQFPQACKATGKVSEIVRWTEPTSIRGASYAEVTYRYVGIDPTPLATKAEADQMAQPKEAKVTLVDTSDGWQTGR